MRKILICLLPWLFFAMPVFGEYYQYKDAQGNLRFTDDIATVPENERADLMSFESIEGDGAAVVFNETLLPVSSGKVENNESSSSSREELDTLMADLDQKADLLNIRKKELESQEPGADATAIQKKDYLEKVNALNVEIGEYKKQRQIYNETVKDFNAQLSLKKNIQDQQNKEQRP